MNDNAGEPLKPAQPAEPAEPASFVTPPFGAPAPAPEPIATIETPPELLIRNDQGDEPLINKIQPDSPLIRNEKPDEQLNPNDALPFFPHIEATPEPQSYHQVGTMPSIDKTVTSGNVEVSFPEAQTPTETPSSTPEPTPTARVFGPARFGNDLGPLMPTPRAETPAPTPNNGIELQTPLGSVTRASDEPFIDEHNIHPQPPEATPAELLTDLNPNWTAPVAPEVHDAMADAKATGVYVPKDDDTQPIDMESVRRIIAQKGLQPSAPANPEPVTTPELIQPQAVEQTVPKTEKITPEMRQEIDRIKAEESSNQPTEPIPASIPLMTTVEQPVQAPAPDPMVQYRDMMANISSDSSVAPVGPDELRNTQPFSTFQQPEASAQTTVEQPTPPVQNRSWIDKLFGRNK